MSDTVDPAIESATARNFLRGLHLAAIVIAAVVLYTLSLPNLIRSLPTYRESGVQIGCFAAYSAVVASAAVLVVRRRPWGQMRWIALAVTMAASLAANLSLTEGTAITAADWSFGSVGWIGVIVLTDRPLIEIAAFLAAHELMTLTNLMLSGAADQTALLWLATNSISSIGFPLAGAIAMSALRSVAKAADNAAREAEQTRTADAVAAGLHERRRQRFASLNDTAVPLLQGLADGSLNPTDEQVQRQCAIEAARMRRLFAETDSVPNPLLHELEHCIDVADRRGILVELEQRGHWPEPPLEIRQALTEASLAALATAMSWARVTVVGTPGLLSVNVVADCGQIDLPQPSTGRVNQQTINDHDTFWVEVQWPTNPSPL